MKYWFSRYFILAASFVLCISFASGQDTVFARKVLDKLASKSMHGRGYVKNGEAKAAKFIAREFRDLGLQPLSENYQQPFTIPMNTFPGRISLDVDGRKLAPGTQYLIASSSPAINGTFDLVFIDSDTVPEGFDRSLLKDKFVVVRGDIRKLSRENPFGSAGIIVPVKEEDNLWWHVSNGARVKDFTLLIVRENEIPEGSKQITVKAKNKFYADYPVSNVAAYVEGSVNPDSFLVVTAHYDHLGMMGKKVYFPGASDNASGTSMLLDLARYYAMPVHRQPYSMLFIACAAEEAGLKGSTYFAEHPLIPLDRVRFLVNLDMVGTGSEGITVVNASVFEKEFHLMQQISLEKHYLADVASRGESCNSDHCPFYQKGVPAVFIYTRGNEDREYHNVKDRPEILPLTAYNGLFHFLTDFFSKIQH